MGAYVTAAVSVIQGVTSLTGGSKEADRLKSNEAAYQAAINGDGNALLFLKQRSGMYGTAFVTGYGSIGGWATQSAKDDARVKYNAALGALDGQQTVADIGSGIQDIVQATGHTIVPGTKSNVTLYLVAGGALIAVLAVVAARKKAA